MSTSDDHLPTNLQGFDKEKTKHSASGYIKCLLAHRGSSGQPLHIIGMLRELSGCFISVAITDYLNLLCSTETERTGQDVQEDKRCESGLLLQSITNDTRSEGHKSRRGGSGCGRDATGCIATV
ncbi:hypothetical protein J6590_019742 [Homalodisca vitripennis]|nr:hypothetical protein J6590_019742 [Homalodisca vitripennis]